MTDAALPVPPRKRRPFLSPLNQRRWRNFRRNRRAFWSAIIFGVLFTLTLFAEFIAHYSDHIAEVSAPFPGALAALDRFEQVGVRPVGQLQVNRQRRVEIGQDGAIDRYAVVAVRPEFVEYIPVHDSLESRR